MNKKTTTLHLGQAQLGNSRVAPQGATRSSTPTWARPARLVKVEVSEVGHLLVVHLGREGCNDCMLPRDLASTLQTAPRARNNLHTPSTAWPSCHWWTAASASCWSSCTTGPCRFSPRFQGTWGSRTRAHETGILSCSGTRAQLHAVREAGVAGPGQLSSAHIAIPGQRVALSGQVSITLWSTRLPSRHGPSAQIRISKKSHRERVQQEDVRAAASHHIRMHSFEQHHPAPSVPSGQMLAIIVELNGRNDVRCGTEKDTGRSVKGGQQLAKCHACKRKTQSRWLPSRLHRIRLGLRFACVVAYIMMATCDA